MGTNMPHGFEENYLSRFCSLVEKSLLGSNYIITSGSLALQEAFNCFSKFAGALFIWLSASSNCNTTRTIARKKLGLSNVKNYESFTNTKHTNILKNLERLHLLFTSDLDSTIPFVFSKLAISTARQLWKEFGECQAFPVLSLAGALVPPLENLSGKVLSNAIPFGISDDQISGNLDPRPSEDVDQVCGSCVMSSVKGSRYAVEPKTGIRFPRVLYEPLGGEVLVGIGLRAMNIIRFKSLKIYAFGLYVHFDSICEKLGHKYASVPVNELKDCSKFYEDLLREDIGLTVRLVVNCNGVKISAVRDVFEKSLRARLQKINPHTDYECLKDFGSYFMEDIPLTIGTTIDFRRTTDGQLITEIGGMHIGVVHSKDLCRAFFDMYIGDFPVSVQTKHEIAENVAGLIKRC
ncbi:hypothetical protein HPP92_009227 [Vanilla planifolia]|uniref:Chalcone--flavanone isomerase n=1 Tax=Vanilla planifolia TaxID=51239 RepID=A0A835REV6_VANPL|nr:hypothetical protein HPP92_009227 [Vanilla planifolia]